MNELQPLIRIACYIAAGYLAKAGLPPEVVGIVSTDPHFAELLGQAVAAVLAGGALLWWRLAKRLGLAT